MPTRALILVFGLLLMQIEPPPLNDWIASSTGETRQQRVVILDAERGLQRTDRMALVVGGKGEETAYWRNTRWKLEPNRAYAFRVRLNGRFMRISRCSSPSLKIVLSRKIASLKK